MTLTFINRVTNVEHWMLQQQCTPKSIEPDIQETGLRIQARIWVFGYENFLKNTHFEA